MDSAELYMMLIRPSMIPIIGEAWTIPFNLQIELATWGWTLKNLEELRKSSRRETAYSEHKTKLDERQKAQSAFGLQTELAKKMGAFDAKVLFRKADEEKDPEKKKLLYAQIGKDIDNRDKAIAAFAKNKEEEMRRDLIKRQNLQRTQDEQDAKDREKEGQSLQDQIADATAENFQFKFSKRVDFASTQMLNSMKQGDLFPTGIITLFQRAPNLNHAASLIMTFSKMRLLDYKLRCEVSDTMTDMREDWTAEFFSLSYVYKGRGMIKKESGAALVTAAVTQGTPRIFSMSMEGTLPI
jgi:type VI protein secretion system component Hcp